MRRNMRVVLGLIAAAGLAQPAAAQVRWTASASEPTEGTRSAVRTIVRNDADRTITASGVTEKGERYEIKVKNDVARATLNGKAVPEDRIRVTDEVIELLGESGEPIVSIAMSPGGTPRIPDVPDVRVLRGGRGTVAPTPPSAFYPSVQGAVQVARSEPPPVMVGINMSDASDTLREHFGLGEGVGFVVDNVIDGLPAAKAGIRAKDIVVSIDGEDVNQSSLRERLQGRKAGDTVRVGLLRKGERMEVQLKLEAYDESRLGISSGQSFGVTVPGQLWLERGGQQEMEEARRALEEAMKAMQGDRSQALAEAREQVQRALEEMRAAGNLRQLHSEDRLRDLLVVPAPPATPGEPSRNFQVLRTPSMPNAEKMADIESRLDRLDERLNKLDDRIGRLLDRLERDN